MVGGLCLLLQIQIVRSVASVNCLLTSARVISYHFVLTVLSEAASLGV